MRARTTKRAKREYRKPFREKNKTTKHTNKRGGKQQVGEEKTAPAQQQIFETTLKRLHTLGNQKFGSSPFKEHFNRWLLTVETVLDEFKTQLKGEVDEQFTKKCTDTLMKIKLQLEHHHLKEEKMEQQIIKLSNTKGQLQQTNKEYLTKALTLRKQKTTTLKQLNKELETLRREQEEIVKLKTGFFRGLSKKEREQKETLAIQKYTDKQQELEITILKFKEKQKQLKEEYENKQEPLLEKMKTHQKYTKDIEEDNSLEDRWFTCETLKDEINNFYQRKTTTNNNTTA